MSLSAILLTWMSFIDYRGHKYWITCSCLSPNGHISLCIKAMETYRALAMWLEDIILSLAVTSIETEAFNTSNCLASSAECRVFLFLMLIIIWMENIISAFNSFSLFSLSGTTHLVWIACERVQRHSDVWPTFTAKNKKRETFSCISTL